jgi:hypothetical protein
MDQKSKDKSPNFETSKERHRLDPCGCSENKRELTVGLYQI